MSIISGDYKSERAELLHSENTNSTHGNLAEWEELAEETYQQREIKIEAIEETIKNLKSDLAKHEEFSEETFRRRKNEIDLLKEKVKEIQRDRKIRIKKGICIFTALVVITIVGILIAGVIAINPTSPL